MCSVVFRNLYIPQKPIPSKLIDEFLFAFEVVVGFLHQNEAEVQPVVEEFIGEFQGLARGDDIIFGAVDDEVFAVAREAVGEVDG